jgi:hypothetical protein
MRRLNQAVLSIIPIFAALMLQGCGIGIYVGEYGICVGRCNVQPTIKLSTTHVTGHGHGGTAEEAKSMARLDAVARIHEKGICCFEMDCTSGTVTGPGFRERWSSGFRETMGGGGSHDSEEGYDAEMKFKVKYW